MTSDASEPSTLNVLGTALQACCCHINTGFYRDGFCHTGPMDIGSHVVCAQITQEFLDFTLAKGNDLMTPRPEYSFPGLVPGDHWCLCASRWLEAYREGVAPPVVLEACHQNALLLVPLDALKEHRVR